MRDEEYVDQADGVLDRFLDGSDVVTAPCFIRYDLTNALLRAARDGRISRDTAERAVQRFAGLTIAQPSDPDERIAAAAQLAFGIGITFYDALYVALARELTLRVVTADVLLHERVAGFFPADITLIQDLL